MSMYVNIVPPSQVDFSITPESMGRRGSSPADPME